MDFPCSSNVPESFTEAKFLPESWVKKVVHFSHCSAVGCCPPVKESVHLMVWAETPKLSTNRLKTSIAIRAGLDATRLSVINLIPIRKKAARGFIYGIIYFSFKLLCYSVIG